MQLDAKTIISITEAGQDFSRVTHIAEEAGQAIIFKNRLGCTNEEIVEVGLGVADRSMKYETLLEWMQSHHI